jgi:hypothetical protein
MPEGLRTRLPDPRRPGKDTQIPRDYLRFWPAKWRNEKLGEARRRAAVVSPGERRAQSPCYAVWMAESFQGLFPTERVNVQKSSIVWVPVREPSTTAPVASSTV